MKILYLFMLVSFFTIHGMETKKSIPSPVCRVKSLPAIVVAQGNGCWPDDFTNPQPAHTACMNQNIPSRSGTVAEEFYNPHGSSIRQ